MNKGLNPNRRIAIIGTGFSGLCIAIHLKKRGFDNFTLFEKSDRLGGTWRDNVYPGAECDVPSVLYSFSFERKTDWAYKWSKQPQILEYMEHCATKYELLSHIQFNKEVQKLTFDADTGQWELETSDGAAETFDFVVAATGQLHKPWRPEIAGAESFAGDAFHSAQWNYDVALKDKNVVCIGNAASAVQFIPQIAPTVKQLTIFQRTANWVVPKNDRAYTALDHFVFRFLPPVQWAQRFWVWFRGDGLLYPLMSMKSTKWREKSERASREYIEERIADPKLREDLVPNYPMGAKRILFSDDYYDALNRDNVRLVTEKIDHIEADAVVDAAGVRHPADVIVYATGFATTEFLTPMQVYGLNGQCLNERWAREGAEAFWGITHTGFPNFFMMYGPNTNLGHNSIIVMIEAQTRYILSCLEALEERGARWLDVKEAAQRAHNDWVRDRLQDSVWANVEHSWYKNEAGKITNNWVGRTSEYRRRTRSMDPADYDFAV